MTTITNYEQSKNVVLNRDGDPDMTDEKSTNSSNRTEENAFGCEVIDDVI